MYTGTSSPVETMRRARKWQALLAVLLCMTLLRTVPQILDDGGPELPPQRPPSEMQQGASAPLALCPGLTGAARASAMRLAEGLPVGPSTLDLLSRILGPERRQSFLMTAADRQLLSSPHLMSHGGKDRRPSYPFITGDGFRAACRLVYDDTTAAWVSSGVHRAELATDFSNASLPVNTTVFVQTHLLNDFISRVVDTGLLAANARPIVLVTHNSDYSSPWQRDNTRSKAGRVSSYSHQRARLLDDTALVSVWYAQNAVIAHPRLVPIPIGLENRYNRYGANVAVYAASATSNESCLFAAELRQLRAERARPLASFSLKTNPTERAQAASVLQHPTFGVPPTTSIVMPRRVADARETLRRFCESVQRAVVVLAPRGHGIDTHRLWETLYLGRIPLTSPTPVFSAGPLAAFVAHSRVLITPPGGWSAVDLPWLREQLRRVADAQAGAVSEILTMDFWVTEIHRHATRHVVERVHR